MSYTINKGINKPIELKGFKAQYIAYLGAGLVVLLIAFAVLYLIGFPLLLLFPLIIGGGVLLFTKIFAMSKKYGRHGLLKEMAFRNVPGAVVSRSRKPFYRLRKKQ
ncbi:DUF4133 domain-containing protein [Fontibacter flavus]|uniref:DUF4133 domain-containing protein n=1 Tax=Fontibacter flavus TaxID=654838 RepID=A0ABV6FV17_9BACT